MNLVKKAELAAISIGNKARAALRSEEGGFLPYGLAWLLGVPITVLIIIYLIRGH